MNKQLLVVLSVISIVLTLLPNVSLYGQANANERCHTDVIRNKMLANNPQIAQERLDKERALQEALTTNNRSDFYNDEVLTIPIVFHVLWNTEEQNVSDERIFSQVQGLNEDFRKMNADTTAIPDYFKPLAKDTRIEFCMATRYPDGTPMETPGITRTYTDVEWFSTSNDFTTYEQITRMHFTNKGGKDIWDSNEYLNVWVCNLNPQAGVLAWAYLPGADRAVDGIVCRYNYLGRPTLTGVPYELGRTMTHEIGHWLNLEHTFGNSDESADWCSDDFVADTPSQAAANFGCPTFPYSTCDNYSDMYMNYMDYADDACTQLYTIDQAKRMRASIYMMRPKIVQSLACQDIMPNDARIVEINAPEPNYCSNNIVPIMATIANTGANELTNLDFEFRFDDDATVYTGTWSGALASGEKIETFVGVSPYLTDGLHKMTLYSINPNGETDAYPQGDTLTYYVTVGVGITPPFVEDFESPYTANGWHIEDEAAVVPWHQLFQGGGNTTTTGVIGIRHGFHDYYEVIGSLDDLNSPLINLSNSANSQLTFDISYGYNGLAAEELMVLISSDCGLNYDEVYHKIGEDLDTQLGLTPQSADDWRTETIDLSAYDGESIIVKFRSKTAGGTWLMLDNISVTGDIIESVANNLAAPNTKSYYQLQPNVASTTTSLHLTDSAIQLDQNSQISIDIVDLQGRLVWSKKQLLNASAKDIQLPVEDLPTGMYLVQINATKKHHSASNFIKEVHKLYKL